MLLVLMDGQSTVAPNNNTTDKTSVANNPTQAATGNEVQAPKETIINEAKTVQEAVSNQVQAMKEEVVGAPEDPDKPKISKLSALIIEESQKEGLIKGIMNGLVILYSSMSDLVLYPVLTTVLAILVIGLILFIVFIIVEFKKENFDLMNKLLIFGGFHTILLINLLFILYEQRKITIKFFSFDKDILLIISSAVVGYFIGRYLSRQIFEDKALP